MGVWLGRAPQRRSWATGPQPEGPGRVVSITLLRLLDRPMGMLLQARLVLETTRRRRSHEKMCLELRIFDRLRDFPHSEIDNVISLTRKIPQPIKSARLLQLVKFPG